MDFAKLRPKKLHFIFCFCLSIGSLVLYTSVFYHLRSPFSKEERHQVNGNFSLYNALGDLLKTSTCRIPDFDPWDSLVERKFLHSKTRQCPNGSPFFIRTVVKDKFAVPHLDEAILWKYYRLKKKNLNCTYKPVVRDNQIKVRDNGFRFQESSQLVFDQRLESEYIWIECFRYAFRKKFYSQPLLLAQSKHKENQTDESLLNVLVLGFDSVSRLNFHRQLRRTREFLLENRANNTVELLGYNKVGLNSGPNQVPLLTGKRFRPNGLYETVRGQYVDNMTSYIWDKYKQAGYATLFFEEQWSYGLFVWPEMNGFYNIPTDYWPRPIMQAIDKSTMKLKAGSNICIGAKPAAATYLDYMLDLYRVSRPNPLWLYAWFSELSHDDLTGAKRADEYFYDFFLKMDKEGYMDNTVVFFIADHGFRFGDLRHTPLGRYEDQLPFGFVLLPEKLTRANLSLKQKLQSNAQRLVTVYDLYKTMLELISPENLGVISESVPANINAYNIFTEEIPADRTCAEAHIDFEFCSCYSTVMTRMDPYFERKLGNLLISKLNQELDKNNDTKCKRWKLKTIDEASPLFEGSQPLNAYRVSVATNPPGKFEACVRRHGDGQLILLSNIDRTDLYSENAHCVMPSPYERYCYCK